MKVKDLLEVMGDNAMLKITDIYRKTLFEDWFNNIPIEFLIREVIYIYPYRDTEETIAFTIVLGIE